MIDKSRGIIASQRNFWAKRKKRSVGGADKSCVSVNTNFYLGAILFWLSGVCSHHYVITTLWTLFFPLSGVCSHHYIITTLGTLFFSLSGICSHHYVIAIITLKTFFFAVRNLFASACHYQTMDFIFFHCHFNFFRTVLYPSVCLCPKTDKNTDTLKPLSCLGTAFFQTGFVCVRKLIQYRYFYYIHLLFFSSNYPVTSFDIYI